MIFVRPRKPRNLGFQGKNGIFPTYRRVVWNFFSWDANIWKKTYSRKKWGILSSQFGYYNKINDLLKN